MADKSKRSRQNASPVPASYSDEVRYLTRKHWLRTQQAQELMLRAESTTAKLHRDAPRRITKS